MGRAHKHQHKIIQNEFHEQITPTMIGELNVYFCTCFDADRTTHTSLAHTCQKSTQHTHYKCNAHIPLIPVPCRVKCGNFVQPRWIIVVCDRRTLVWVARKHLNVANTVLVTKLHRHFRTQIELESCVKLSQKKTFYFILFLIFYSSFDISYLIDRFGSRVIFLKIIFVGD